MSRTGRTNRRHDVRMSVERKLRNKDRRRRRGDDEAEPRAMGRPPERDEEAATQ